MKVTKQAICAAVRSFVEQRPGLRWVDFDSKQDRKASTRRIQLYKHDTLAMLAEIEDNHDVGPEHFLFVTRASEEPNLWLVLDGDTVKVETYPRPNFAEGYRFLAACLCASVLTIAWGEGGRYPSTGYYDTARKRLGKSIAKRYFHGVI